MQDKLKDVADVRDGTHDSPKYLSAGIPLVTSKNVSNGQINYDGVNYISLEDYKKINTRSKVDINDILMGMIGTIGNLALIHTEPSFAIKNVALIKDTQQIFYLFLYYYLQSPYITKQLFISLDGGTQKFISLKKIRNLFIRKTNSLEQKRVSYFFKSLDSIITLEQKKIEKLELLKEYLLQNMFADESGYPKVRFSGFTEEWIQDKGKNIFNKRNETSDQSYRKNIQLENIESSTGRLIGNTSEGNESNSIFYKGDVLYGRLRPYLNKWWLASEDGNKSGEIWALYPISRITNLFLYFLVQSFTFYKSANISSGSRMPRADWKIITNQYFNIPKPKEQEKISKFIHKLEAIITLEQTKLDNLSALKQKLLSSLFI
ncbi:MULTISPECIES: restriction endonuclease subunit S [Aerococcus]|uniref:restriction endonuclease subunit S n=1 Tax=Aerococcus TaxID=1375 RepID=UPI0008A5C690|nr:MULTISPECIES: restriction endonuclease subunit S [Aerococcus]MDK6727962.1 restriction endonuclease subunit S [Aerococcus urinae]MDK7909316.1 restriction endonuclease subunit S [Aerococcus urinae]MDK8609617.1 restriction endonuclease subunit S [Aerococcus urinae]MDL5183019.1 restriction endonuclease subunit S [Aerococcus loyolae]WIK93426.1 restriction endonuclease subunit S [Aerococcus loyolae]